MRLPLLAPPVLRQVGTHGFSGAFGASGCPVWKQVACAGRVAACIAICVESGGAACIACIDGLGDCRDCL